MRLPLFLAALFAALACQTSAAPTETKKGEIESVAPPSVSIQTSLNVLPALDSKQIVVGLIEREDFEGSVADEAARARSATREGRKIVVPPEVTITSGSLKVEGELLPGRRGRIIEMGKDGIPIVHGIREPDDESDNQVWRNADVIEGQLFPGGSIKAGRALNLEKEERLPAHIIQSRILSGGDVHVIEATPVEDRQDQNSDKLESTHSESSSGDDHEYAASHNSNSYQQSHQVQPSQSSSAKKQGFGSVEVVDLEPGYVSNKREYVQQPQKKKTRKQQQQEKFQQTQQQFVVDSRDESNGQDGFNPSQYYNNYQQQQPAGYFNGYETNYLHAAAGEQEDSQGEESNSYSPPQNQFQQYQQQIQQQQRPQRQQQQHAPVQVQQGSAPKAGQVLPNGGVVIGPADPNDFVIQHQSFANGISVPVPVPAGQFAGVQTQFVYEEPSSDGLIADLSDEELYGQTQPAPQQRPFNNRPNRRPVAGREQFQGNGNRRPPFYPPLESSRPQQQQFVHSHARPGRPQQHPPRGTEEESSGLSRVTNSVRQAMRRRYQQFQNFMNPVVGPLRQAGQQIGQNLGISESLDNINERFATVVGAPALPLVLGGALTIGALGLGAHALNNFEISVNRGGSNKRDEKTAKAASVTDTIEAATKAYSDSTPSGSTATTTTTTAATTVAKDPTSAKPVELKPSGRQAKVLTLEEMELRRRKRSASDDPDFMSNMLEVVESPEAVYYAKMGDEYATRKKSPCVGKIGCQVTSVIYPSIQRFESNEAVPSRAPRHATSPME